MACPFLVGGEDMPYLKTVPEVSIVLFLLTNQETIRRDDNASSASTSYFSPSTHFSRQPVGFKKQFRKSYILSFSGQ
jgi:hypothetical protein